MCDVTQSEGGDARRFWSDLDFVGSELTSAKAPEVLSSTRDNVRVQRESDASQRLVYRRKRRQNSTFGNLRVSSSVTKCEIRCRELHIEQQSTRATQDAEIVLAGIF